MPKWENQDLSRMNEIEKKDLLRDQKNIEMILPAEQTAIWELKVLSAYLIEQ